MQRTALLVVILALLFALSRPFAAAQTLKLPTPARHVRSPRYQFTLLVRSGDPAPGVRDDSVYAFFQEPLIADDGTVAFTGLITSPTTNSFSTGLFTTKKPDKDHLIALTGQSFPHRSGFLTGFGRPALDKNGTVAYLAQFSDDTSAIYVHKSLVAELGGATPGVDNAWFVFLTDPTINAKGEVAFGADYFSGSSFGGGVFTPEQPLAFDNAPIPGLPDVYLTAQGNVAWLGDNAIGYTASLSDGSQAVFGAEEIVIRTGDLAPDTGGLTVQSIDSGIAGNDKGDIAYMVWLDAGSRALYVNHRLVTIEGEMLRRALPGCALAQVFWPSSGTGMLDTKGDLVYAGLISRPAEGIIGAGVFLSDRLIALTGQSIGSPKEGLTLQGIASPARINRKGQIVFIGVLSNGEEAIVTATPHK